MLFPYTYVPHQMEKMQEFIDFIFYEVWCKAPGNGPFSLDLFNGNPELKEMMSAFYYGDTQGGDFFYGHVERIYGLFSVLRLAQISQFKQWYKDNNDIENVCANASDVHIVHYADIEITLPELSQQLASFFTKLYSKLDLAVLRQKIGDIDDHYKTFIEENKSGKCPFCGINDIKGIHHTKRDAYDHYLPKALYPFNSINFRNLAPVCHECNSSYKLSKDPVHNGAERRKAFYPYANPGQNIELEINLTKLDIDKLDPGDIHLAFGPSVISEEIETWKDVYGIEERYKAKCCSCDAKDWLEEVRILCIEHGMEPTASLSSLQRRAKINPFANSNLLKKAFLEACQRAGLLDAIAQGGATP